MDEKELERVTDKWVEEVANISEEDYEKLIDSFRRHLALKELAEDLDLA